MKKYELTSETRIYDDRTLYRIKATKNFGCVKAGDLGGWIEKEKNLSHDGLAWAHDNAIVCGDGIVRDNAIVRDRGIVCDRGLVRGRTRVGRNGYIKKATDILTIGPIGSRDDYTTFYVTKSKGIYVSCGCFNGSIGEFEEKVKEKHGDGKHAKTYLAAAELAKMQIELDEPENQ